MPFVEVVPKTAEPVRRVVSNTTEIETGTYFVVAQTVSVFEMVEVTAYFALSAVAREFSNTLISFWDQVQSMSN